MNEIFYKFQTLASKSGDLNMLNVKGFYLLILIEPILRGSSRYL